MSQKQLWKAPHIVPSLAYQDVTKAVDWLGKAFGLTERAGARITWPGGAMTWIEVGDSLINLSTSGGHEIHSPQKVGGLNQSLKVYVDDVDAHFQQAKAAGATIVSELEDGFWGGRIYRAKDLEGHLWEFSQIGVDQPIEDWQLPPGAHRETKQQTGNPDTMKPTPPAACE